MFDIFDAFFNPEGKLFTKEYFRFPDYFYTNLSQTSTTKSDENMVTAKELLENLKVHSTFQLNEDGKYVAVYHMGDNVKGNMIDVEVDDDSRTISVSYKYESENGVVNSSCAETIPQNADIDTMDAVFDDGDLTVTMDCLKVEEKTPTNVKIKRRRNK